MKAVVWTKYGPPEVLQLKEVEKPLPKANEVLVRVLATSAFAGDCELRRLHVAPSIRPWLRLYIGLVKPKRITILGQEMSGVIEAVGSEVKRFHPGDQVFGISGGMHFGCYAEYVCIPEYAPLVIKPECITFEQAAVLSASGLEAIHFLDKAGVMEGQRVLINGAGGSIGTLALQMAKMSGAHVTCVDGQTKLQMLTELGADEVIDYVLQDFTKNVGSYDLIFDVVGRLLMSNTLRSLKKGGTLILGNPGLIIPIFNKIYAKLSGRTVRTNLAPGKAEDLERLKDLICTGKIRVVIDRKFPLERMVDAHRFVEMGHKKGNVVITVLDQGDSS
ncbi:MAG TPA: NAD(P)-dependent alcohol dehydrogenase [Methanomassiliicoccales archaeon]|nr:NAD(P)-dependent alcohol dehydrogenase [Methanomassiliicoccales archaeon]